MSVPESARPLSRLVISADQGEHVISRHLYGHFAEHLGRGIYDGFWEKAPNGSWRLRTQVLDALRPIKVPNLRWPGGCFADAYHWKDGIGPAANRPSIVNSTWGGVTEDNSFGTHEFMQLVRELGADPVIVGNVGSGTVQEMAEWWEYLNHPGPSPMANLRAVNGRSEPYNVKYWGVGNENWGCGGNMRPMYYADLYRRFATYLPRYGALQPFRIAAGPASDNYEWMDVVMREAGHMIDGVDLHHYTVVGSWANKGAATGFPEAEWMELFEKSYDIDRIIRGQLSVMDRYDPEKRVWLIVGEWGTWHKGEPGSNPGFLYQQNSLRDALGASVSLDIFNSHADRVKMANIAQTVNVLQAMLLTEGDVVIRTPTFYTFEFYTVHHDATLLPIEIKSANYEYDGRSVRAVSATASRSESGVIHVTMTNLDPHNVNEVEVTITGASVTSIQGRILTADRMDAHNTFQEPDSVKPAPFGGAEIKGDRMVVMLPAKSLVLLALE